MSTLKPIFKFLLWVATVFAIIAGIMKATVVDLALVGHNAMAPTMITGEQVLIWTRHDPERGDIVICENPADPSMMVVGRVVAVEGSVVGAARGHVVLDGDNLDRNVMGSTRFFDVDSETTSEYEIGVRHIGINDYPYMVATNYNFRMRPSTVGPGEVFLLSDNLSYLGQDSRTFGPVAIETCVGQIFLRWKPVDDGGAGFDHGYFDIIN